VEDSLVELVERVRAARERRVAVCIRAGGTKDFYGNVPRGEPLDPRVHRGIVDYEPSELVVTARCGTSLASLQSELDARGQMLAFEPPHFGDGATVGGCVASGLSGPRRAAVGAVRDFVLGAHLLDGRAQVLQFGGTVMKNVAGYDVARLLAGSMGTLGLILQVSLKVLPKPPREATLQLPMDEAQALESMNLWAGHPLPVSATRWRDGCLTVRLSGAEAAVRAARQQLGGTVLGEAAAGRLWRELREQSEDFFSGPEPLWRLSVPSAAPGLGVAGTQLIEWGGDLRWLRTPVAAAGLRARALALGGHVTLFRGGDRGPGIHVFAPLARPIADIHRRLKREFDPDGLFNPGRLFQDNDAN
jgi:glycolate oxidase FAD binding subunit